jgi:hypothetical protein
MYNLNEAYFDTIDTHDKAYWLGLLYADGYNNTTKHLVTITLQACDKYLLEAFRDCVDSDRPLYFVNRNADNSNWQDCYALHLNSKRMSDALNNAGMMKAKSLILEFPDWLNRELYSSFLLGYLDGDGGIYEVRGGCQVKMVGTVMFCEAVQKFLWDELEVDAKINFCHNKNTTTRCLCIYKQASVKRFLDYVYKDSKFYLTRKYEKYKLNYLDVQNNINNPSVNVAS